jgi:hypothetical protein
MAQDDATRIEASCRATRKAGCRTTKDQGNIKKTNRQSPKSIKTINLKN